MILRDCGAYTLRLVYPRCTTVTDIQSADAIPLYGGSATVDGVGAMLRHDICNCDLIWL